MSRSVMTQQEEVMPSCVSEFLGSNGWEAGTRTPIARSRDWSPTIGRPPSKEGLNLRIGPIVVNFSAPKVRLELYKLTRHNADATRCTYQDPINK